MVVAFLAPALFLVPAAYQLSKQPPRFTASAVVLLEARPDRLPLFQEFSPFRPLSVQIAILRSRSLAEGVLEALPRNAFDELVDQPHYIDYTAVLRNAIARWRGQEPEAPNVMRRALTELQRGRMKFSASNDGIVEIAAEASRPQVAVDIVNTYIDVLLARTRTFNVDDARTSREFLEQQLADVKKTLRASEDALRAFNAAHGGVRVPDRSQATLTRLSQVENSLAEVETNRKMVQTRLQALREKVEAQKRQPGPPPVAGAPVPVPIEIQRVRAQLAQLETALLDLRTKFTEQHPRVVLVKERIAEVQRQLGNAVRETSPTAPSPTAVPPAERVNFSEQMVAMETTYHSLVAQEVALRKQAETLGQDLSGLSRSELDYTRLTREVESSRNLHALMADKLIGARIREQGEMKVVKVIDPPAYSASALPDKSTRLLVLALLASLAIGGGLPAAVEWLNRTIDSEDDVKSATGLPVLAVLPRLRTRPPRFLSTAEAHGLKQADENFMFSEALRNLRVTIQLTDRTERPRSILVTSAYAGDGKSTLVLNLGMAFGEAGYRVVLADSDFQRPSLHRVLKVAPSSPGLTDAMEADRSISDALVPVGDRLWIAPRGGSFQPEARGMLATNRLKTVIEDMEQQADMVLCDSSPVLLIPDNLFLAAAVDGVILIARAGSTTYRDLARTKTLLDDAGARVLGVVMNEVSPASLRRQYSDYYSTYIKN
jgi:capsular exopolysaccharide synthesis family protein